LIQASRGVQARFVSGAWNTDVVAQVRLAEAHARVPAFFTGANQGKVMLTP
jgi:transglutaminase-like putative cysteine protease